VRAKLSLKTILNLFEEKKLLFLSV